MDDKYILLPLPPKKEVETKAVLKQLAAANRYLAELKGVSKTIPNSIFNSTYCNFLKLKNIIEGETV